MQAVSKLEKPMPLSGQKAINRQSLEELQKAFSAFTEMSENLSESYQVLEQRVVELSGELATLSEKRLHELNEKERIAEQLEGLLRLMPAAVIVLDNKGVIRQANPTAEEWIHSALGSDRSVRLIGLPWAKLVRAVFAPKQTDYHEVSLKDGRLVSLDTSALDNSGQLIMMTDQTETRALQAKVSRQERLSAMGQMVASLAHQIRTPLSAAMLYASNIKSPSLDAQTRDQFADKLVGRLQHLEKQVQDMLLFVKGEVQLINLLSVQQIFDRLQDSVAALPENKRTLVQWNNESPEPIVRCQADVLINALMNLINNAIEAQGSQTTPIVVSAKATAEQIVLTFQDQGPGLSASAIEKIQEPFYTTKSYGTGLGIPVLVATVNAHNGQLNIQSEPGVGTEFSVSLPIYQKRSES
ncbi:sensor histidine kinase [Reinekea blandensis]|uniref:histidine kinase n=1 Tax=Reinekea blandensis MED297 TaxID=314283 RepID=A4BIM7_9GAMM|nr:ATP-binding protein [Reinekea blandensis]EAR07991.1 ATP-binding region, ATPase-like:Histidine kinase A, N-terminal [Reinekea sp. MED297] [Reinekea blandensis MED297]